MQRFNSSRGFARRLRFETLEVRRVLATFTVTNLNDGPVSFPGAAPGTLRQAIYDANHTAGADVVQFAPGLSGTINLSIADDTAIGVSALLVSSPITIQGNTSGITIARSSSAADMRLFHVTSTADLTLDSISITNGVVRGTDGVTLGDAGGEGRGGAIYNEGILRVVSSTIYANKAIGGNGGTLGGAGSGRGGAVYSDGGTVIITNSTFSGDVVQSGTGSKNSASYGGGIYIRNGALSVYNSTFTNNSATTGRGIYAIAQNGAATASIWSSIVAQTDTPVMVTDFLASIDVGGQLTVTGGNNLIRVQNDYQFITVSTDDPSLGPLANNGGPTMTHALLDGSPAINLGSNPQGLAADQRGNAYARVTGGTADIGAFESQSVSVPTLAGDYSGNHVVDAADYVLWRTTLGASVGAHTGADGSGNGAVDVADYTVWRSNFGSSGASGTLLPQAEHAIAASTVHLPCVPLDESARNFPHDSGKRPVMGEALPNGTTVDLALLNLLTPLVSSTANNVVTPGDNYDYSHSNKIDGKFDKAIWENWSPVAGILA